MAVRPRHQLIAEHRNVGLLSTAIFVASTLRTNALGSPEIILIPNLI
jgi:hypothetical protein